MLNLNTADLGATDFSRIELAGMIADLDVYSGMAAALAHTREDRLRIRSGATRDFLRKALARRLANGDAPLVTVG